MSLIDFFALLVIFGICATLGQAVFDFRKGGFILASVLGILGALLGIYLSRVFSLPELFTVHIGTETIPIIWSIMGSGVFVIILNIFVKRL
jgi:uncharacterized membrane protein YeaQ/YmgE (transglycosylase-associated protein family)